MKIVGYIVICDGRPLVLCNSYSFEYCRNGILVRGTVGTIFKTKRKAQSAINRTMKHKEKYGFPFWPEQHEYTILGLTDGMEQ